MKRTLGLGLVILLGFTSWAGAITFGKPDGDRHPHVGTLLFVQNNVGFFSCTGTLISPTVMLTAGHCVEGNGNLNDVTYVRFDEDAFEGFDEFPNDLQGWLDDRWILADEVIAHPEFDDYSQFPQTFDVGLVILSEPVQLDAYGMLPPLDFLREILDQPGNTTNRWTAVGYGLQGVINPFFMDDYARYRATVRLIEIVSSFNGPGQSAKFTNNPGRVAGGTCFGDSGGPIFYKGTNIIGAIVSFGITPCIGVDYQFRIDTATAQQFIMENLP